MERVQVFAESFAVMPSSARVVDALYGANGQVVSQAALMEAGRQTRNGMFLTIKRLRAVMDQGSIACAVGEGYWLTKAGLLDCDKALLDAARRQAEDRERAA